MTGRYCQQEDVYAAERVLPIGRWFARIDEMQAFTDSLIDSWWWTAFYPEVERITVLQSDGPTSFSYPTQNIIAMFEPQWTLRSLSHELTHVFARHLHHSTSHDPWYARERLVTTYCLLGPDSYSDLYTSFLRHGIEVAEGLRFADNRIIL